MAPPKNVTEVPRTILPRLTWNGSSPRATLSPPHSALAPKKLQRVQTLNPLGRRLHTLTVSLHSHRLSGPYRGPSAHLTVRGLSTTITPPKRPSIESHSSPVRYNGVYVAAFKPARRAFHASPVLARDHHFDTLKFVKRLKAEGFSEEQAVAMMRVLNDVIQESIQNLTRTMVLKEGQSCLFASPALSSYHVYRLRQIDLHPKGGFCKTSLRAAQRRFN